MSTSKYPPSRCADSSSGRETADQDPIPGVDGVVCFLPLNAGAERNSCTDIRDLD